MDETDCFIICTYIKQLRPHHITSFPIYLFIKKTYKYKKFDSKGQFRMANCCRSTFHFFDAATEIPTRKYYKYTNK
jgi:hypothetical protein